MKKTVAISGVLLTAALLAFQEISTSAGAPQGQQTSGAPQGTPRGTGIEALALDDRTGFEAIFDGKTLKGWDGDPVFWRVESGVIVGESTAEKPLKANIFLIWRGGQPKDFELKLEYRING